MRLLYRYVQITSRDGYPIDYLSIFLDNTVSLGSIVLKGQWLDSIPKSWYAVMCWVTEKRQGIRMGMGMGWDGMG